MKPWLVLFVGLLALALAAGEIVYFSQRDRRDQLPVGGHSHHIITGVMQ